VAGESEQAEAPEVSWVRRIAALATVAVGVLVAVALLVGDDEYEVSANFENASQLVEGGQVVVGGHAAGSIKEIGLAADNTAIVTFSVDGEFAPLPRGTKAQVNPYSLSSIANNQIELTLPPDSEEAPDIPDGGAIPPADTVASVDLDQVFNTLDDRTLRNLKKVIRGFELSYAGVGEEANKGFRYLNPFLYSSRGVFAELNRDERVLERLVVDTSQLSGALAERAPDISELIHNLNLMMGALGRQKAALAASIAELPDFMRRANTTFVNLRAALDDLDPLVDASKPVAERLRPFLAELRRASADAVPTFRDLDQIVLRRGRANDLVELTELQPPLEKIAIGPVRRNGAPRRGAFPETAASLEASLPQLAFLRPYTPELVGWFDDFSHSGFWDANGGFARQSIIFNAFTIDAQTGLPQKFIPYSERGETFAALADIDNVQRCPGGNERDRGDGSTPFVPAPPEDPFQPAGGLECDPEQVPPGP
jgi:phospholipid/cholesterol/gamma-HCH transport system substrate-binding protein